MFSHSFWNYFLLLCKCKSNDWEEKFNHILKKECFVYSVQIQIMALANHFMGKLRALFVCPWTKGGNVCWYLKPGAFFRRERKNVSVYFFHGTRSMMGVGGCIISFLFSLWYPGTSLLCTAHYSHQFTC